MLAGTLNRQVVVEVKHELASLIGAAEAAHGAVRTILSRNVIDVREPDKREAIFLAQLQAQPALSQIAFGWPDGSFFSAHELPRGRLELSDIPMGPLPRQRRVDTYRMLDSGAAVQDHVVKSTTYDVTAQPWYQGALSSRDPLWTEVTRQPGADLPSIAYASSLEVGGDRQGVLAVMIDLDRLSRFLATLVVGRSGAAFVLDSGGAPVVVPHPSGEGGSVDTSTDPALLRAARLTHDRMLAKADPLRMEVSGARVMYGGLAYSVTVTPLDFMGWEVTTVVPEADFLGELEAANEKVSIGIILLVLLVAALAALSARRLLVEPLTRIVGELGRIQRFELDRVGHRPARLRELDELSRVVSNMASGLAAFRKYLPADLVNTLIVEGVEASPGGTMRPMTILFADVSGFTGLSERLGEAVFPLLARYIDVMSSVITAHGGTIDKFMGDGVMAFWGAPEANPRQEADACRAALSCLEGLARADIRDDLDRPLVVRIGINSGDVLVGNVGTHRRLNYTVIGDAVNVASRIEVLNKTYGTSILIGPATRQALGDDFLVRRIDHVAIQGRAGAVDIHELVGATGSGKLDPRGSADG